MSVAQRPLAGFMVGLSISESEDSETRGFPPSQVNRVTVQVVSSLFGQGVGLVFGHDWRDDGVMQTVYAIAREMQPPDAGDNHRPLQNLLPWPDVPTLSDEQRQQLSSTLLVERAGLPDGLREHLNATPAAATRLPEYRYLRARALTHMRRRLEDRTHARLCIGGRSVGGQGRFPGVIEEAFLTFTAGKPLYLVGLLGGAARQVITALEGAPMPEDFCKGAAGPAIYETTGTRLEKSDPLDDRMTSRERVWATFAEAGVARLAKTNGLEPDENHFLFHTPSLDDAVQMVLVGLSRLRHRTV